LSCFPLYLYTARLITKPYCTAKKNDINRFIDISTQPYPLPPGFNKGVSVLHGITKEDHPMASFPESLCKFWRNLAEINFGPLLKFLNSSVKLHIACNMMQLWVSNMQIVNIMLSQTTRHIAFTFGLKHHLDNLDQSCLFFAPGFKNSTTYWTTF